jgi:TRAP-type C4-dicarboxylate transport system permease small subunit
MKRDKIDQVLGNVLALFMAIMTIDVLWGVFTRYAMGSQASWSEELARFLLVWIGILGAAYAAGKQLHLSIDLLKPSLNDNNKHKLQIVINLIIVIFALTVMVIGGLRLMYITFVLGQLSPALRIPMYLVYGVVPLSGALIIYYKLADLKKLRMTRMT